MTDSRFFRKYINILEAAPTVDQSSGQVAQGVDKFSQGNYASGAMDVAQGANDMANAAGMTLGDKLTAVGMAIKAAGSAALAQLRGRNPAYAAMGSLAKNVTGPAVDYVNSPKFAQEFKAGIDAARANPQADARVKQMVIDYDQGLLTPDSFKAYIQRISGQADSAASGQAVDFDDSPNMPAREELDQLRTLAGQ